MWKFRIQNNKLKLLFIKVEKILNNTKDKNRDKDRDFYHRSHDEERFSCCLDYGQDYVGYN